MDSSVIVMGARGRSSGGRWGATAQAARGAIAAEAMTCARSRRAERADSLNRLDHFLKVNIITFMGRGPSTEKTERTRARILAAAETLLATEGYAGWTMSELARRAECAVGLVYRYFPTRASLVLALYGELAAAVAARVDALEAGSVGARFAALVTLKVAELDRRPRVFRALAHAALSPDEGVGVLSDASRAVRAVGLDVFTRVVAGADNAPADAAAVGRVLYGLHLLVVLLWTQQPAPPRPRAADDPLRALVSGLVPLIDLAVVAADTPVGALSMRRLDALARSILEPSP
jgi:AcrR family transcriptional regulator